MMIDADGLVTSSARKAASTVALGAAAAVLAMSGLAAAEAAGTPDLVNDPVAHVDPLIGTANRGNTFPGAVLPFGMVQWSPENTRGDHTRTAAPGGYHYDATRIRGFALTHLSGTGCRGASGDVPFMPVAAAVTSSPSDDRNDGVYASRFSHANETALPGYYQVRLASGVNVELTATERTGSGRFTFPSGRPATMLIRASDSEVGSSDAEVTVDPAARTVRGSVASGNFCGYIHAVNRRSYYTLHFVAVFDRPFSSWGAWEDDTVHPGRTIARGGTGYGPDGYPVAGKGSGAYVVLDNDTGEAATLGVRVGISYVSADNAEANLQAENPPATSFDALRRRAREAWNERLRAVRAGGGTRSQLRTFYTALYHALLHPNLFSDVNGQYRGFDGQVHSVAGRQRAQYANFSGWDVYRSQIQLLALLDTGLASDVAQSLLNQAGQYGGVWDRWTHNSGPTHVMTGDPSAPTVAGIVAFGGTDFDVEAAFRSLLRAATVPTVRDLSNEGCPVMCRGQRPSLDKLLSLGYVPTVSNSWGGAGETLEQATADFSLAQLARRLGEREAHDTLLARARSWKNVFNPEATPHGGYVQNRNQDGSWPEFDPAASTGFAEGSSAQYTWMVPFDARGLFEAMGGNKAANRRLDDFFRNEDGSWALTGSGGLKAELDNQPSIGTPWLYLFSGRPHRTQQVVRHTLDTLWNDTPYGIPGNDDLGTMSAWYAWAAIGLYPGIPGRAELLIGSPLFPHVVIRRSDGTILTVSAPGADADTPFVHGLRVDGKPTTRPWLPESFVAQGGTLDFVLAATPDERWGADPDDAPPSHTSSPAAP